MNEDEHMLTAIRRCRRIDLYTGSCLDPAQEAELQSMRRRRAQGEPLQYILGKVEFFNVSLRVDPRVLIPRPETEILVEEVLRVMGNRQPADEVRILDLGTGSGNIAIALAKNLPACRVTAVDISQDALQVAGRNAAENDVANRIKFCQTDMADYLDHAREAGQRFDVIVSNPPYIKTSDLDLLPDDVRQEPRRALDGGVDGLDYYRTIIARAAACLADGGFLFCEMGDGQAQGLEDIFRACSFKVESEFIPDYTGTKRIVRAQWKS